MIKENWEELSKRSKVTRVCETCSIVELITVEALRASAKRGCGNFKNLCKSCSTSKRRLGAVASDEVRQKISTAKKGKPTSPCREGLSRGRSGDENQFYGKKHTHDSIEKMLSTRNSNPLWIENMRLGISKRDLTGSKNGMWGKPPAKPKRRNLIYKGIMFRSSWELKFAQNLDSLGTSWEYEPFTLKLIGGSGYTPDFVVNNSIYEIKGYYWNDDEKFQLAKALYTSYNFFIIEQKILKWMGVI